MHLAPEALEIRTLALPLSKQVSSGMGGARSRRGFILVSQQEHTGVGEIPALEGPGYGQQSLAEAQHSIAHTLRAFLSRPIASAEEFDASLDEIEGRGPAKAALSMAIWDLSLKMRGQLCSSAFPPALGQVPCTEFRLGLDNEAPEFHPFPRAKARKLEEIASIIATWDKIGYSLGVLDLNGTIPIDCLSALNTLVEGRHLLLEEPLALPALSSYLQAKQEISFNFALDETLSSPRVAELALHLGICPSVTLKLAHVGSISGLLRLARKAARHGVSARLGGMFDSGVGRACSLLLSQHLGLSLPSDCGSARRHFEADLCLTDPISQIPDRPGYARALSYIGLIPPLNPSQLNDFTEERVTLQL